MRKSTKATNELKKIQMEMKKPKRALIQEVEARWNSAHDMLAQDQKDVIRHLMISTESDALASLEPISPKDWQWIEFGVNVLKPLLDATMDVSGDLYVTASIVVLLTTAMLAFYAQTLRDIHLTEEQKGFVSALHSKMVEKFHDIEDMRVLTLPALLDPRYKKFGFRNQAKLASATRRLKSEMQELQPPQQSEKRATDAQAPKKARHFWLAFEQTLATQRGLHKRSVSFEQQYRACISEEPLEWHENPQKYWNTHQNVFPTLYQLYQKYVTVQARSVSSKRTFSSPGNIIIKSKAW